MNSSDNQEKTSSELNNYNVNTESQEKNNESIVNNVPLQEVPKTEEKEIEVNNPRTIYDDESLELLKTLTPNTLLPSSVLYPGQPKQTTPSTECADAPMNHSIRFSHTLSTIHFNSDTIIAEKIDFVNRISAGFKKLYKSAEVILTPYERRCNRNIIARRLSLISAVQIFHREGT